MSDFKLTKHRVKKASFTENEEKEKKKRAEFKIEGGILIPKSPDESRQVMVRLNFSLGKEEERLCLVLETLTVFEAGNANTDISEEKVQRECVPLALERLRKTVKMVTEAYGMPALDLPSFEEEDNTGE